MSFGAMLTRRVKSVEHLAQVFASFLILLVSSSDLFAVEGTSSYIEAQALLQSGKWAEASLILRTVLEERPRFHAARLQLASALVRLDRRSEALADLNRWVPLTQGSVREQLITKIRTLSRVFLDQKSLQTYLDGVQLLSDGRKNDARAKFSSILDKERDHFEILLRLGQTYLLEADYESAAERLRSAVQLNPFEPAGRLWLGRALLSKGDVSGALPELKQAKVGFPNSELASIWLAEALGASGDHAGAVSSLEKEFGSEPNLLLPLVGLCRQRVEGYRFDIAQLQLSRKGLLAARELLKESRGVGAGLTEGELSVQISQNEDILKEVATLLQTVDDRLSKMGIK